MANREIKQSKISKPKIFSILSLISAIAAGHYFIGAKLFEAIAFTAMASIFDSASIGAETPKQKNWRRQLKNHLVSLRSLEAFLFSPEIKNAFDRIADAAIFIGFAMSGIVSETWGAIALILVIVIPYWIKLIWKISIRRFFHAGLIARVIYFILNGV